MLMAGYTRFSAILRSRCSSLVTGAFEFLVDHFVHTLSRCRSSDGGYDGEATTLFDVARGAEEALWALQRVGIHTAGEHLAGRRHDGVVGAGQSGDGVEQNHHVFFVLNEALGFLDHHLGNLHVPGRRLVEGARHHLAAHGALTCR